MFWLDVVQARRLRKLLILFDFWQKVIEMSSAIVEQPPLRGGRNAGYTQYHRGGPKSVARLRNLQFDPIGELVAKYRKLESEIEYQEKIKTGEIQELGPGGRVRAYRPEVHHALYDKLITIGKELLRYGYGRVPEQVNNEQAIPQPLIVNLTAKGEVYVVNESGSDEESGNQGEED